MAIKYTRLENHILKRKIPKINLCDDILSHTIERINYETSSIDIKQYNKPLKLYTHNKLLKLYTKEINHRKCSTTNSSTKNNSKKNNKNSLNNSVNSATFKPTKNTSQNKPLTLSKNKK